MFNIYIIYTRIFWNYTFLQIAQSAIILDFMLPVIKRCFYFIVSSCGQKRSYFISISILWQFYYLFMASAVFLEK